LQPLCDGATIARERARRYQIPCADQVTWCPRALFCAPAIDQDNFVPELPEVETVRRGLQPVMEGARIVKLDAHRPDLRRPLPKDFAKRVEGKTVLGIGRRAKYLTVDLSSGDVLLMHLGMSGSLRVDQEYKTADKAADEAATPGVFHHPRSPAAAHDHVVFHMSSGATVTFNDPRRFGLMLLVPRAELDQTVVAGLGNIYVCEALHRAHLSPKRPASTIATRGAPNARAEALVDAIKAVLNAAIKAGGSSLRDHRQTDGELGYFQHHFRVYDREGEPCPTPGCKGTVKRIVQNGRSTFFCPVCQK
jgi:formamidopyrimidine-DNA glycosylase